MANNPNDIARILNEMAKTLQELSDAQLDSVKSIVEEKLKQKESLKTIKRKESELTRKIETDAKILIEQKKKKNSLTLLSINTTKNLISKTRQSLNEKTKKILSVDSLMRTAGLEKELTWAKNFKKLLVPKKQKPIIINSPTTNLSQSKENFSVKEDIQLLQLEALKSIDSKISDLRSETSSNGLFDFLFKAIPKLLSGVLSGGGALAGGALGLGKYSKLFKLPNLAKGGASLLTKIKNPKVAIPLILGSVAVAGGTSLYNMLGKKEEEKGLEGRAKGGSVQNKNAYVVGEDGPEIFVPKENGNIIPNNKIKNTRTFSSDIKMKQIVKDLSKDLIRKIGKVWSGAFIPFKKTFKTITGKLNSGFVDWKEYLSDFLTTSLDKLKTFLLESIPKFLKSGVAKVGQGLAALRNFVTGKKETPVVSSPNVSSPTPSSVIPKTSLPTWAPNKTSLLPTPVSGKTNSSLEAKSTGDYNIKQTKMYKIHQNEMVIPKKESELLRAISELRSDYNMQQPVQTNENKSLDKSFWVNRFIPAFQKAIKSNKIENKAISNRIASAF
jgi:hypothetical protein